MALNLHRELHRIGQLLFRPHRTFASCRSPFPYLGGINALLEVVRLDSVRALAPSTHTLHELCRVIVHFNLRP